MAFLSVENPFMLAHLMARSASYPLVYRSAPGNALFSPGLQHGTPTVLILSLLLCIAGCAPSIAPFSSRAYEQAVDLKIDTLRLIERAEEPYGKHSSRIEALQIRLLKAREYARGRPYNDITTRQWEIMVDTDGFMAGGFLSRWASEDSLSWAFIQEASLQIASGFDTIIRLESGKARNK